jgi:poly(A) polymerase
MIKKLIGRVLSGKLFNPRSQSGAITLEFKSHSVSREQISTCALQVTDTLQSKGFSAYVVGGAVRDLLLKRTPKDYDVATNATPEQVHGLFRRSRIIGRRFQIVHVMSGRETVEVSTFRAAHDAPGSKSGVDKARTDEHGRILRDNVFGNQQQDATRRDLTINALFYDPSTMQLHDFHGGVEDLKAQRLRLIGDPSQRYREDPVRMLRVVRFAAALNFQIDPATRKPIRELSGLLSNVPAARLFDEMLKMLLSGHAVQTVKRLREEGLHGGLLPLLDVILEQPLGEKFVMMALENTDERIRANKGVSPGFLFSTLLWHEVLKAWRRIQAQGLSNIPALYQAMEEVLQKQSDQLAIPRRLIGDMKELWALQPRFLQRNGRRPFRLLELPRFRAGYDFMLLRCQSGELDMELADWWTQFQEVEASEREEMLLPDAIPKKRRRRKRSTGAVQAVEAAEKV